MSLAISIIGSKVLRKKAEEVDKNYEGLEELIETLFETMDSSNGIGLAAPQVNKSIRIFVVNTTPLADDEATKDEELAGFRKVFINPKITERFGKFVTMEEGCLSVPDIYENVSRKESVKIEYYDEDFVLQKAEYSGVKARVLQHEYDHLEGILFTDKIAVLRRKLLKNKLVAISKGKFVKRYKFKLGK